jgi:hypothetical protein
MYGTAMMMATLSGRYSAHTASDLGVLVYAVFFK